MNLPPSLTTVTPFSKLLAALLFMLLPLSGFLLGMKYQQKLNSSPNTQQITWAPINKEIPSSPSPTLSQLVITDQWQTFSDSRFQFTFEYPGVWKPQVTNNVLNLVNSSEENMVSFSSFNPALVGITFCAAYRTDPRCEGAIDWLDGKQAVASMSHSNSTGGIGITITLHQVDSKTKDIFRRIVSTLQF